ncbi:unnamed protein product [Zymoseptoria tritici ST99CH_1A5]|uniref:Major facilitator superfamily (MFS) profile domain-containing protein n=1 Tax=Zymoseptoria tritici ST99CH_1A5 TaxID=1276529 RepID=A0A1Y6LQH1_ZYMTR|nr:unnamed protein product [Zymoseptoria tritici ST99CH_1A5]
MAKLRGNTLGAVRSYSFACFVCLAGFMYGYDTGIVGGVLTMKAYQRDFRYHDKTTVSAVMVSLQNVGCFLAALCIFPISERFGRKKTIQVACSIFVTGVILQTIPSHSLPCFYIGRFTAGLGLGGVTAIVPCYNAEQAPKEIRGRLGSFMQLLFTVGVMISYWVDYATVKTLPISSAQWQIPVGLQMVPAFALGFGLFFQKESTRWLAKKGRNEEAWESLSWMRADDGAEVKAEFEEIKAGIAEEARAREGLTNRELLEPANRYRLALATGVFMGQQTTGMTALAYFGPQFFKLLVGSSSSNLLLITGLFGVEKFTMVGIYLLFFSERWGRKPTLWISALAMSVCFVIVVVMNKTTAKPVPGHASSAGIATVAMIFFTNSIHQFSWAPVPWLYTSEIFPSRIREVGVAWGVATGWLFNFLFSLVTPYMIAAWGSYVFLFYSGLLVIMAVLSFMFLKETKNKTLEEMEAIFNSRAAFDNEAVRRKALDNISEDQVEEVQVLGKSSGSQHEVGR